MDTTPRKRTKIMTLHEHTTKNQSEIAKIVGMNQSTVTRILKEACETDSSSLNKKGRCGRKRKTLSRDITQLLRQNKKDLRKTSDELSSGKIYSYLEWM